ncbi:sulfur carrier protein ThiS [Rubinisphaera margarita]|uniref:sulfur carrier protein ThiS n=1 Tax=Rubinisphaera margarita TaxID=2909586 RepID=UPI001EE9A7CB|nr:sulfur carrier protein ThiS [Rubinisphaera margarita]MCG6157865.1 sulfur carrier protein ThiS [Rubinisphaera margarita]
MPDTIEITLNGEQRSVSDGSSIADLLQELNHDSRYLAVECNRELVPRRQHSECRLQPGDVVEIVTLVGGG